MANPSPITPPPGPGRPKGSKNTLAGTGKIRRYRLELQHHADAGDVLALGFITLLDALERQPGQSGDRA